MKSVFIPYPLSLLQSVEEIRIQIKRVRAGINPPPLPGYMTDGSVGMDLAADLAADLTLAPLERKLIPTGIAVALPLGYEAQIRPRSGLALSEGHAGQQPGDDRFGLSR